MFKSCFCRVTRFYWCCVALCGVACWLPIFSSNWCSWGYLILVINLPGSSRYKTQMVAPRGAVFATVSLTRLVTPCSWRLLSVPGVCSALVEFAVSGLLWARLPVFINVPGWIQSCRFPWLGVGPTKDSGHDLLPWKSQTWVFLDLQRSWLRPTPSEVPNSAWTRREVFGSCLLSRRSLTNAQTCRGSGSGLLPQRSLVSAYSLRGPRLMPGPAEVSGSSPLPQRLSPVPAPV